MLNFKKIKEFKIEVPSVVEVFFSTGEDFAIPYYWGITINNDSFYGREFKDLMTVIEKLSEENDSVLLYTYDPTLFEGFFSGYYRTHSFSPEGKNMMKFTSENVEVRAINQLIGNCTFEQFNNIQLDKRVEGIKTPNTVLPRFETYRMENVLKLESEFIHNIWEEHKDDMPLTAASLSKEIIAKYCLQDRKTYQRKLGKYDNLDKTIHLPIFNFEHYCFLRSCFAGGFIGYNFDKVGETLEDVVSVDFTSHFISCLLRYKYPMKYIGHYDHTSDEFLEEYLNNNNYWCLMEVELKDFHIREDAHCVPLKKTVAIKDLTNDDCTNFDMGYPMIMNVDKKSDNVRYMDDHKSIRSANRLVLHCTKQDLEYLYWFYDWQADVKYNYVEVYDTDYLPEQYCRAILELFRDKSLNKDNPKKFKEVMSKTLVLITWGVFTSGFYAKTVKGVKKEIEAYNKCFDSFTDRCFAFQWGIACTSYARYSTLELIKYLGKDWDYSDTDSFKLDNYDKWSPVIEEYNRYVDETTLMNPHVNKDDICIRSLYENRRTGRKKLYQLGHLEIDGVYKKFKYCKPKCYLYLDAEGKYDLTMSGVSNFRPQFFDLIDDPFDWFTFSDEFDTHYIPKEYCDYSRAVIKFKNKDINVTDINNKVYVGHINKGCYKIRQDYYLCNVSDPVGVYSNIMSED